MLHDSRKSKKPFWMSTPIDGMTDLTVLVKESGMEGAPIGVVKLLGC